MQLCGCTAPGRHSSVCQGRPKSPPSDLHVLILELKGEGLNSGEVHKELRKRGVEIKLGEVNKFYATPT